MVEVIFHFFRQLSNICHVTYRLMDKLENHSEYGYANIQKYHSHFILSHEICPFCVRIVSFQHG